MLNCRTTTTTTTFFSSFSNATRTPPSRVVALPAVHGKLPPPLLLPLLVRVLFLPRRLSNLALQPDVVASRCGNERESRQHRHLPGKRAPLALGFGNVRVLADGASVLEETVRQGDVLTDEQRVIFFAEVLDEDDFGRDDERRKRKAEEEERVRRRRRERTVRERFEKFYDDHRDDEIDRVERFEAGTNDAGV